MASNADDLARLIGETAAPENLYPLAASAVALMAHSKSAGPLLVAHTVLIQVARRIDGEQIEASDWLAVRRILKALENFIVAPDLAKLDALAKTYNDWAVPPAMH